MSTSKAALVEVHPKTVRITTYYLAFLAVFSPDFIPPLGDYRKLGAGDLDFA
jgi:hypothetical protein